VPECQERIDQLRIEPLAPALPSDVDRRFESVCREEDFDGLRQAADPPQERNLFAFESAGVTAPIPVFIEIENGGRGVSGQLQAKRQVGAALAPDLGDLPGSFHAAAGHGRHLQQLVDDRPAGRAVFPGVSKARAGFRPVDHPAGPFDEVIIGAEQISHFGGVARAAQIFQ
jgi:hypothetical protein